MDVIAPNSIVEAIVLAVQQQQTRLAVEVAVVVVEMLAVQAVQVLFTLGLRFKEQV